MLLPNFYRCTSCREKFLFAQHEACYHLGVDHAPLGVRVPDADL